MQWNTHFKSSDFSTSEGWVSRRSAQVMPTEFEILWDTLRSIPLRDLLSTAHCRPEELKESSLVPLFIGSPDDWLQASVIFHPGHNPHDADSNCIFPVLLRMYSSDIYQAGETPGIRSFRCCQGEPDHLNSLLLYKDKESAKLSRFTAHQVAIFAVWARIQCWLVLGLPGVSGGYTSTTVPFLPGLSINIQEDIQII